MGTKKYITPNSKIGDCVYLFDVQEGSRRHSRFVCGCGNEFVARTSHVISGTTKGCGCQIGKNLAEISKHNHPRLTHGFCKDKRAEYGIWASMHSRCSNPNSKSFPRYGGRGIRVCNAWDSFAVFMADMGERPSKDHSIERLNNDDGYSPGNCKWALPYEQRANRSDNRILEFKGEAKPSFVWGAEFGISGSIIRKRIARGWDVGRAITTPSMRK